MGMEVKVGDEEERQVHDRGDRWHWVLLRRGEQVADGWTETKADAEDALERAANPPPAPPWRIRGPRTTWGAKINGKEVRHGESDPTPGTETP